MTSDALGLFIVPAFVWLGVRVALYFLEPKMYAPVEQSTLDDIATILVPPEVRELTRKANNDR